jgi:hypothetical protein
MTIWHLLYLIGVFVDTYLAWFIGLKVVRPLEQFTSRVIWVPAAIISIVVLFERIFFMEYSSQIMLMNMFLYLLLIFGFVKGSIKSRVLFFIIINATLTGTEAIGAIIATIVSGITVEDILKAGYFSPTFFAVSVPVIGLKLFVLWLVIRWKVRNVEAG